jgi:glycerate kinase
VPDLVILAVKAALVPSVLEDCARVGTRHIHIFASGFSEIATQEGAELEQRITAIARLKQVELTVACDVTTTFTDAAVVFAPQKGATPAQVELLSRRLDRMVQMFRDDFDVDVTEIEGGGAAGGLGAALAALGGRLVPGVELVADELDLYDHVAGADLVITGEGHLDPTSFDGKVVGGVASIARDEGVETLAIVGSADPSMRFGHRDLVDVVSLVDEVGCDVAFDEPKQALERAAAAWLAAR